LGRLRGTFAKRASIYITDRIISLSDDESTIMKWVYCDRNTINHSRTYLAKIISLIDHQEQVNTEAIPAPLLAAIRENDRHIFGKAAH